MSKSKRRMSNSQPDWVTNALLLHNVCISWGFEWGTFAVTWPPTAVTLPPTAVKHSHSQVCAFCQDFSWISFIESSLQTDNSANIWQAESCSGFQSQKTIAAKNKIILLQLTALLLYSTCSIIIYSVCRLVELVFSLNYLMVLMCFHWFDSDKCRNPRINPLFTKKKRRNRRWWNATGCCFHRCHTFSASSVRVGKPNWEPNWQHELTCTRIKTLWTVLTLNPQFGITC